MDDNGNHVTRAELGAHLQRIDERLANIERRLDARPVQRWLAGRFTGLIDKGLPVVLVAVVTYLLAN